MMDGPRLLVEIRFVRGMFLAGTQDVRIRMKPASPILLWAAVDFTGAANNAGMAEWR